MDKKYCKTEWLGALFVVVVGSLFHFMYDLLGRPLIVAPLFAMNESVWEHLKLLFWPTVIILPFMIKNRNNYFLTRVLLLIAGLVWIPLFYYLLQELNIHSLVLDIGSFIFTALLPPLALCVFKNEIIADNREIYFHISVLLLFLIAVLFIIFSYYPPDLPLFTPPA